jgi:hypothetical protein
MFNGTPPIAPIPVRSSAPGHRRDTAEELEHLVRVVDHGIAHRGEQVAGDRSSILDMRPRRFCFRAEDCPADTDGGLGGVPRVLEPVAVVAAATRRHVRSGVHGMGVHGGGTDALDLCRDAAEGRRDVVIVRLHLDAQSEFLSDEFRHLLPVRDNGADGAEQVPAGRLLRSGRGNLARSGRVELLDLSNKPVVVIFQIVDAGGRTGCDLQELVRCGLHLLHRPGGAARLRQTGRLGRWSPVADLRRRGSGVRR